MDAFASTSPKEAFGIALVEAMAIGLPVIAIDAPGPREILDHDRTGLIVDPRDPAALAAAIEHLAEDGGLRARLGAAGRERYRAAFTPARMCERMQAQLEELARG
jgi:glycosyltransferase involved in cell wall biosynthesis